MGGRSVGSSLEISSEENTHSYMAGDAANSERDSASTSQLQWEMETVDATGDATLVGDNIALSARIGDTKSDTSEDEVADPEDDGLAYSLLFGDVKEETDNEVGITSEESMALLAHEMLCCPDSGPDSESENDHQISDYYLIKECQKLDGSLEYGLHNPYQLMDNDEDVEQDVELKKHNKGHAAGFHGAIKGVIFNINGNDGNQHFF
ncbi:uncharacterized protein LOC108151308 isoform X2 [Drosophila miranda]|uniref:uncharacterized protein LOC108151308 isoform X2 n=1 Tax=Drosophila miranda TaxID=7229 RepID=UPI0007E863CD|nr:uncharacterized protein LOC108151308 isoform X2 [Drosophila miranda]